jgi:Glycosyl hydrolase family 63 C-terminal domain
MPDTTLIIEEDIRLKESRGRRGHWKRWGPYLSERAWGTVREDYSAGGDAWGYLPHKHARSKAYRWNEEGLGGISDQRQFICFALSLWNGRDPMLKERLFGLTGPQGNHGEDVKEYYFYLDSTPTHSYMKYLYKYPQAAFPYSQLIEESQRRGKWDGEYELMDTGVFNENRYFDVFVEYAKASVEDILIRLTITNHGPEAAQLEALPTVWFRNTWSWNLPAFKGKPRPTMKVDLSPESTRAIKLDHFYRGQRWLVCDGEPELCFTENETNKQRLYHTPNDTPYVKDGINNYIVNGMRDAVNPAQTGTKAAARYKLNIGAGETVTLKLRLTDRNPAEISFGQSFDKTFQKRLDEADEFYDKHAPAGGNDDIKRIQRQAFAGMLWSKQFYYYDVKRWLRGDPGNPVPPAQRLEGRNKNWMHLNNESVISMPDKWEYPWYAAWDLAFHCIPLAVIDPEFAKEQLILMLREWYMHPNGQIPAYEWKFEDVNPPVHAWAAWRVYTIERRRTGKGDRTFLERVFHKLLMNFTWWVNRKDTEGNNVFEGGFLGLDNIGVFDRSAKLPTGGHLEQSDATSWMGMYCLNMLTIALELAKDDPAYEDVASKFMEHFVYISSAMNKLGEGGLWNERDGFYYDVLNLPDGTHFPLRIRSMVGLIPLFAVETLEPELLDQHEGFNERMLWFMENAPELGKYVEAQQRRGGARRIFSLVNPEQLRRVLAVLLDEKEFLSPHGIRSLSKFHERNPYTLNVEGQIHRVDYEPAESRSHLFGGNSNWRGPIWFPVNYLIIESLQKFHYYLGNSFLVECPTGSGRMMNLWDVSMELSRRLTSIFTRDAQGQRPVNGADATWQNDPRWRDYILFYEYFHGDNGAGLGASHQTGWTGLVAKLIQQVYAEERTKPTGILDPKMIQNQ